MIRTTVAALGLACVFGAGAAGAQAPAAAQAPETGCTQPLPDCTKARTAALQALARKLTAAARMKAAVTLNAEDRARVQTYDRWLRTQSQRARELAERGTAATTAEIQTAFNREYLQMRERLRREHGQFDAISTIMKAKHDAVTNAIGALR